MVTATCKDLRVLAIEPFYGGSHRTFLDGLIKHSRHDWSLLTLPARHWKWRMRSAPFALAGALDAMTAKFDVIFASDFVDLATLVGLRPDRLGAIPSVIYFHENQFTYPVQEDRERDHHFAITNLMAALAAHEVWFNSHFHRADFFRGAEALLARMPDTKPAAWLEPIRHKARVEPLGLELGPVAVDSSACPATGPLTVLWNHRWEYDKNPEAFVDALRHLKEQELDFRLVVCGERFRHVPDAFTALAGEFEEQILHWGYVPSRAEYLALVRKCDVVVSTALHDFFGISIVEAVHAGCRPLLPRRLAYPELVGDDTCFYDNDADLAAKLIELAQKPLLAREATKVAMTRFDWSERAPAFDRALETVARKSARRINSESSIHTEI